MDPVSTYFESIDRVAARQREILGDLDLRAMLSSLGGGTGASKVALDSPQTEQAEQEQAPEPVRPANGRFCNGRS